MTTTNPATGIRFIEWCARLVGTEVRVFARTWTQGRLQEVGPDWLLIASGDADGQVSLVPIGAVSRVTFQEEALS
jgi:hypothetical protein